MDLICQPYIGSSYQQCLGRARARVCVALVQGSERVSSHKRPQSLSRLAGMRSCARPPSELRMPCCGAPIGPTASYSFQQRLAAQGMRVRSETGPQLISEMVRKQLGIDCSVLMVRVLGPQIAELFNRILSVLLGMHNRALGPYGAWPRSTAPWCPVICARSLCPTANPSGSCNCLRLWTGQLKCQLLLPCIAWNASLQ
jgi:hypothetical protein